MRSQNRKNKKKHPAAQKKRTVRKISLLTKFLIVVFSILIMVMASFLGLIYYIDNEADTLIQLEKKGKLSKTYGYIWNQINLQKDLQQFHEKILQEDSKIPNPSTIAELLNQDYPSLAAIHEMNNLKQISNSILLTDRNDISLAEIKTTQNLVNLSQVSPTFLKALISAEDSQFFFREKAYEINAFIRALYNATLSTLKTLKLHKPKGTSTIHQQVARFLLLKYNDKGYTYIENSLNRKRKEVILAQALKQHYSNEDILQFYINHCISVGKNSVGINDVAQALFKCTPKELSDAQSLYISRLVKWNRNIPTKIKKQVLIDLPRIIESLEWSLSKQEKIKEEIKKLSPRIGKQKQRNYNHLVDLANENWLEICRKNNLSDEEIRDLDLANNQSLIRQKGHLKIQLTLDIRLQNLLEKNVAQRGFGRDSAFTHTQKALSYTHLIKCLTAPMDTVNFTQSIDSDTLIKAPWGDGKAKFHEGDIISKTISYKKIDNTNYKRSVTLSKTSTVKLRGQYYSYVILHAETGEILAYCSRDKLGSRLTSLIRNTTPNASSLAKPYIYGYCYDFNLLKESSMTSDSLTYGDSVPWHRNFTNTINNRHRGVVFRNSSQDNGYIVHNHHRRFDGYKFYFEHLASSNNIIAVENIYRLNHNFSQGNKEKQTLYFNFFDRLQIPKNRYLRYGKITGPQIYMELLRSSGISLDSTVSETPQPDDLYSIALGTYELSLYHQAHLFNGLYNNKIIISPEKSPSLAIKSVHLSGKKVIFDTTVQRFSPFSSQKKLYPVHLALHKRLLSGNPHLHQFDVPFSFNDDNLEYSSVGISNYAKSGTTTDILKPYNHYISNKKLTNYGLWNATLRISLNNKQLKKYSSQIQYHTLSKEQQNHALNGEFNITVAAIGECNEKNTGPRNGKSLHQYVTTALLTNYGVPFKEGFYKHYENQLIKSTPDSIQLKNLHEEPAISERELRSVRRKARWSDTHTDFKFRKRFLISGVKLERKSYLKLMSFTEYMGTDAHRYKELIENIKSERRPKKITPLLEELKSFPSVTPNLQSRLVFAATELEKSLVDLENE